MADARGRARSRGAPLRAPAPAAPRRSPPVRSRRRRLPRCDDASLEAGGASAAGAVAPADVHFAAAGRTAQLARWRLAALRAKVHLSAPRQRLPAIRALPGRLALLRQLERRSRSIPRRFLFRRPDTLRVARWRGGMGIGRDERWRGVDTVATQEALGGQTVEAQDRVGELAEQGRIRIPLRRLAPQRLLNFRRVERDVAALSRQQPQHGHLVVLVGRGLERRAVGAVRHQPLVHLRGGERLGEPGSVPSKVTVCSATSSFAQTTVAPAAIRTVSVANLYCAIFTTAAPSGTTSFGLPVPWNHGLKRFRCSGIVNSKP